MAAGDKLWFEVGVRDELTKELNKMIGKANELQRALEMTKGEKAFDMKPAYDNAKKLERALFDIDKTLSHVSKAKITATDPNDEKRLFVLQMRLGKMRAAIERFRDEFNKDPKARKKSGLVDSFLNQIDFNEASYQANNFASSVEKNVNKALLDGTKAAEGLVSAYDKVTEAGKSTNKVFAQLSNQFGNLVSVYGAERLLKSIITIGGQFEIQHVALQNILGDAQEANVLFEQLQALAVESPMTFRQIAAYTKQLAAFSIPADELFDTTRRLADLSTGLGVDMSRLILAYGQVRSAAVLRGQELRQFTEAGIPLVQRLADEFTKLNGKVVKTGEVFSLISKRQVPFEMVQKILWDMTNEGGQFYNMQALIAETLAGKWQKLSDVWEQALGRLAEGSSMSGKVLKGVLETVISVISNLEKFMPLITGLVTAMGAKSAVFGLQRLFTGNADNIQKNIAAAQRMNALAIEREFILGRIDAKEKAALLTRNADMRTTYSILASTGRLNTMQMTALYLKKQITAEDLRQMAAEKAISQEQMNQIMSTSRLGLLKMQAQNFFGGLFSFGNIATMGVGLGVGYLMSFISDLEQAEEKARQVREQIGESANGIVESSKQVLESTANAASQSELFDAIGVMSDYLKNNAASWDSIEEKMLNLKGPDVLKQKYDLLKKAIEGVNEASNKIAEDPGMFENANDATGGWFTHGNFKDMKLDEVMKKTTESLENFRKVISSMSNEDRKKVAGIMDELIKKYKRFGDAVKENGIEENLNKQLELLRKSPEVLKEFQKNFFEASWNGQKKYGGISLDMDRAYREYAEWRGWMYTNMDEFIDYVKGRLTGIWVDIDFSKLTSEQEELVMSYSRNFLKTHQITNKDVIEDFYKRFGQQGINLKVNLDKKQAEAELEGWQKMLDDATNKQFTTYIKAAADIPSAIDAITKLRKEAEAKLKQLGPMALNFGINFTGKKIDKKKLPFIADHNQYSAMLSYVDQINEVIDIIENAKAAESIHVDTTPKNTNSGSKKDKVLDDWKNRVSMLEKYRKELEELEKYMTRIEAENKLRKEGGFDSLFHYFTSPNDYKASLDEAIKAMGKNPKGDRQKFVDEQNAKKSNENLRVLKDNAKDAVDELQRMLSVMSENYNVYKKWMELTGDADLAARVAGVTRNTTYADYLSEEMRKALGKTNLALSPEDVFGLSESNAKKLGKDNGIFKIWEDWQKNQQKVRKEQWDLYEEAYKGAKNYDDKVGDINRNLQRQIALIKEMKDISPAEQNRMIANLEKNAADEAAKVRWEQFKDENNWGEIFTDMDRLTTKAIDDMIAKMEEWLPKIKDNETAVKDLYNALDKMRKEKIERNPFTSLYESVQKASRLRQLINSQVFGKDGSGTFTPNAKSAKYYGLRAGQAYTRDQLEGILNGLESDFGKSLKSLGEKFKAVEDAITPVITLFDMLGEESLGKFFQAGSNAIGAAAQTAKGLDDLGLGNMGPYGAAAAAALSLVSSAFALHDEALQEEIEASKQRQKEMENLTKNLETALERTLGGVYTTKAGKEIIDAFEKEIANPLYGSKNWVMYSEEERGSKYRTYLEEDTLKAVKNAEKTKTYYDAAYASMLAQRDELKHQMVSEEDKKDSDSSKISDYKQEIMEMEDEIEHFAEDMAKALYDIDVKSWAQELGDALFEAWQKGEDGAEAFKKKASELMADLAKNIAVTKLIETAMAPVLKIITSEMERTSGKLDEKSINAISEQMAIVGGTLPDAFNNLMDGLNEGIKKAGLTDMKELGDDSSSSSTSSSIKSITEQTADILASYINAIRADVSVNRYTLDQILITLKDFVGENSIAQSQLEQLKIIASNTLRSADAAETIANILHQVAPDGIAIRMK